MTLIITLCTQNGIMMFADSRATTNDTYKDERLKILKIDYLNAGISFYGQGKIENDNTGIWLQKFIDKNRKNIKSIDEFSSKLNQELNMIDKFECNTGFHIAGFSEEENKKTAIFHHLTNKSKNDYWDKKIEDNFKDHGIKKGEFKPGKLIHNGDYLILNRFLEDYDKIATLFNNSCNKLLIRLNEELGKMLKNPFEAGLAGDKNLFLVVLRGIVEFYNVFSKTNNQNSKVGGEISYILINMNGIVEYNKEKLCLC